MSGTTEAPGTVAPGDSLAPTQRNAMGGSTVDLLVVGAGPTGMSAAIAAANRGMEVVVVDPREGVIDKACGEGLMPGVLPALERLGVRVEGRPFYGVRYLASGVEARGKLPGPGLGVRRTALHGALCARAEAVGVRREVGRITEVVQDGDFVRAGGFRARWLIAADGLRSTVREALGLDVPAGRRRRYGVRRHYAVQPWSDTVDVHWTEGAEAYVTPVGEALVGVALLFDESARAGEGRPFDRLIRRFPELAARLGEPVSQVRGAGPFAARSRRRVAGRVLLVGDAAGYEDPITGEGTKIGVLGAMAAVDALAEGCPERWEADWRRLWRPYALGAGSLARLAASAVPPAALPRLLGRYPWIFDRALALLA